MVFDRLEPETAAASKTRSKLQIVLDTTLDISILKKPVCGSKIS
jgi:hypothetical protein